MTTKQEAHARLAAAGKGCEAVQDAWQSAVGALSGGVAVNGFGIYHDQGVPLRLKLLKAQDSLKRAIAELDAIDWPTDADYDFF